jgi:GNAT superfamily N-acetyltransferase
MTATITVSTAGVGDDAAICELFDRTVLLGGELDVVPVAFDEYRRLCVGWYLEAGRTDAAVARDSSGEVVGYALVCTDEDAAARWSRRWARRLAARVCREWCAGRLDQHSRAFYLARGRDAVELARARRRPPAAVHAHLNVDRTARTAGVALALLDHIDERCRLAGRDSWYGELNERDGSRRAALQRIGMEVVDAAPNHTLTMLLGQPVRRLTLLRRVPGHDV